MVRANGLRGPMAYDLFIIGGGINGCGIARDAVGRGYSVALAEMNDFASATSSASTKLFHGGLRYLEYFEFRLVREALIEREVLLKAMPHISWPMRFVLPVHPDMRFDGSTPTSKLLGTVMPWMKGRRPDWLIRLGLFLYDNLGGRKILPGTATLDLRKDPAGAVLQDRFAKAYEYSDCWVEDARLVLLNARDAAARGADVLARTKVLSARWDAGLWHVETEGPAGAQVHQARMLVNAGGPWVEDVIRAKIGLNTTEGVRLVRGSHIIVPRKAGQEKCYFFQGADGRIIFAIPYEEDYTLIGTTDEEHGDADERPVCTPGEIDYLCDFVSGYLKEPVRPEDVVWTYSGVRPLYDDGASSASAATRDYVLKVNRTAGGPVLNIFGGKITTYRKLAESALGEVDGVLGQKTEGWTAGVPLPGGDFPHDGVEALRRELAEALPFFDGFTHRRLLRQYGTLAAGIFADAGDLEACGQNFGHGVTAREVDWAIDNEWVHSAEDFLWRRSKMGLRLSESEAAALNAYISGRVAAQ